MTHRHCDDDDDGDFNPSSSPRVASSCASSWASFYRLLWRMIADGKPNVDGRQTGNANRKSNKEGK